MVLEIFFIKFIHNDVHSAFICLLVVCAMDRYICLARIIGAMGYCFMCVFIYLN